MPATISQLTIGITDLAAARHDTVLEYRQSQW